jgi:hypothetical protein
MRLLSWRAWRTIRRWLIALADCISVAFSAEVSFYDFPSHLEADRKWIEQCFGQAARIYGGIGGDHVGVFDPVFCADDWHLPRW